MNSKLYSGLRWVGLPIALYASAQLFLAAFGYTAVQNERDPCVIKYIASGGFRENFNALERIVVLPLMLKTMEIAAKK